MTSEQSPSGVGSNWPAEWWSSKPSWPPPSTTWSPWTRRKSSRRCGCFPPSSLVLTRRNKHERPPASCRGPSLLRLLATVGSGPGPWLHRPARAQRPPEGLPVKTSVVGRRPHDPKRP